jgi:xylulose-5-phosphate/fructose-6-phosphate phosphoketolase
MIVTSSKSTPDLSMSAFGKARSTVEGAPLSAEALRKTHAYWRACNYLAIGMIYLRDNALLRSPLKIEQIKHRILGHWGTSPGLSFAYIHLNRLIKQQDLNMIFLAGPGHGAPGVLGPCYLEGTYSEIYPDKSEDEEGLKRFFKQFSFPGGIGSHCTPETPGSINAIHYAKDARILSGLRVWRQAAPPPSNDGALQSRATEF